MFWYFQHTRRPLRRTLLPYRCRFMTFFKSVRVQFCSAERKINTSRNIFARPHVLTTGWFMAALHHLKKATAVSKTLAYEVKNDTIIHCSLCDCVHVCAPLCASSTGEEDLPSEPKGYLPGGPGQVHRRAESDCRTLPLG